MEIPGQTMLLEPFAQVAERAGQRPLQLLKLAHLAACGLPSFGRRLPEGTQLRGAVVEETPRPDTGQIGQCRRNRRAQCACGSVWIGVRRGEWFRDDAVGDAETLAFRRRQRSRSGKRLRRAT